MDEKTIEQCSASGTIEKVIQEKSSCGKFIEVRLINGDSTYYINGLLYDFEEGDDMIRTYTIGSSGKKVTYSCENMDYQFKNLDLIQPGKQVYVIANKDNNKIIELSQENIIKDLNLDKCYESHYYNLTQHLFERRWIDKCKLTGEIQEIKKTLIDKQLCGFNLYIKVLGKDNNTYYIKGDEQAFMGDFGVCIAPFTYPDYINGKEYFPQIGDEINVAINRDDNSILSTISESDINNLESCQATGDELEFQDIDALTKEEIIVVINKLVRDNNEANPESKIHVKTYYNALYLKDNSTGTLIDEGTSYDTINILESSSETQATEIIQEQKTITVQQIKPKTETSTSSNYTNTTTNTQTQVQAIEIQQEEIIEDTGSLVGTGKDLAFSLDLKSTGTQDLSGIMQVQELESKMEDKNIYQVGVVFISIIIVILLTVFLKYVRKKAS
ncbi:MAG: hypothetical protein PHH06_03615 [Candidatus Gracilibacteria bacterium]|nr:hypothetical protein [Candidatus Gracilibacteria bacterium]